MPSSGNITRAILDAQQELIHNPFDIVHDVIHHFQVCQNCLFIIEAEKLSVELPVVIISAWWHDIDRDLETKIAIIKSLEKNHFSNSFIKKCLKVIKSHSFGKKQISLEAKVLFDADKLEYVNPLRTRRLIQAINDGVENIDKGIFYKKGWFEKTPQVKDMLHFSYSKSLFDKLFEKTKKEFGQLEAMTVK
ncbi:hypothetical protein GYA49_01550 [Candidatus Beckwithbacteria bacterium]|nr:hypothetical protein [Candidatus Beckwithbacteria bacterium]